MEDDRCHFTPEEARHIQRRVVELPESGPLAEQEFHRFLERLRKNADLYASLLFGQRKIKLVSFDLKLGTATIKDEEGQVLSVSLRFDKP